MKHLLFLFVTMAMACLKINAADFSSVSPSGHTLFYNIIDATNLYVEVTYPGVGNWTGYTKPVGSVTIPNSVNHNGNTYVVTQVSAYAFSNCTEITNVIFPNTLISIGSWAFEDCSISNVSIPDGVKYIHWAAFTGNPMESVSVPNSVEFIDHGAFSGGTWLNSKPDGIVYLGKVAYTYKGEMPNNNNLTFNSDTKCITGYFLTSNSNNEKVASITLPNSLLHIGTRAFYGCGNISQITIPQNVESIGGNAFSQCGSMTTVNYNAVNSTANSVSYNYVFSGCENLSTANVGNSVQVIPPYLFAGCTHMTTINMSESVIKIGSSAFANTSITSFTIPRNLDTIGSEVFTGCSSLQTIYYNAIDCNNSQYGQPFSGANGITRIVFGNEVQTIPNYLCYNMTSLQNMSLPESIRSIGDNAFFGCTGLSGTLTLPSNLEMIGGSAFYGCVGLSGGIIIPNMVHRIGSNAFYNCNNVTSLTIGTSVDTMQMAFANMGGLTSVHYNVTSCQDGLWAFQNDQQISSISFGNNVQSIPDNTIIYLPNVTSLVLPEGLIKIGQSNFSSINLIGTLSLPSTLQEIGYGVFSACGNLSQIVCNASTPPIVNPVNGSYYIFMNHFGVPLHVPCGSIEAYRNANGWSFFANITGIGDCGYTINVSSNNTAMGYVQGGGMYNEGESCILTAIPYTGFQFDHWQDGNGDNPRTMIVMGNASYVAYFIDGYGVDENDDSGIVIYAKDNKIYIEEAIGEKISVYSIDGKKIASLPKAKEYEAIPVTTQGVYVVKVGNCPARKVVVIQ